MTTKKQQKHCTCYKEKTRDKKMTSRYFYKLSIVEINETEFIS